MLSYYFYPSSEIRIVNYFRLRSGCRSVTSSASGQLEQRRHFVHKDGSYPTYDVRHCLEEGAYDDPCLPMEASLMTVFARTRHPGPHHRAGHLSGQSRLSGHRHSWPEEALQTGSCWKSTCDGHARRWNQAGRALHTDQVYFDGWPRCPGFHTL